MLLKTKGSKIGNFGLATMYLKINEIETSCHDVDENKAG